MVRTGMLERKETKPQQKKINFCQLHNMVVSVPLMFKEGRQVVYEEIY